MATAPAESAHLKSLRATAENLAASIKARNDFAKTVPGGVSADYNAVTAREQARLDEVNSALKAATEQVGQSGSGSVSSVRPSGSDSV